MNFDKANFILMIMFCYKKKINKNYIIKKKPDSFINQCNLR